MAEVSDGMTSFGPHGDGKAPLSLSKRLTTAFACILLIVLSVTGLPPRLGMFPSVVVQVTSAVLLAAIVGVFTWRNYFVPIKSSHRATFLIPLPDAQVYTLQRSAGHLIITPQQARMFAVSILVPTEVRERITERYDPAQRTLTQRVTIEGYIAENWLGGAVDGEPSGHSGEAGLTADNRGTSGASLLFPLLIPRKGTLVDNLRVYGGDQAEMPVLSHRQYLQVVAQVLRTLLSVAYGAQLKQPEHASALQAEHLALAAVMRRGAASDESGIVAIRQLKMGSRVVNKDALELAASLVERLASNYAIVASIPWPQDHRFIVTYQRLITPSLELAGIGAGVLRWAKARARLVLGARPVDISVPLENACTSQSYHLIIDGQEGVFVGHQSSAGLEQYCAGHAKRNQEMWKKEGSDHSVPPPYFRFRKRAGQRYGHFYTRFFPEPLSDVEGGDVLPSVRFRFFEVPPGSVFRATVAAIAATALIWLIAFVSSRKNDPGTDVPAFLLVFPALAAAWLGFDSGSRRLLEGTLAARISLAITALCSVAGSGLFMVFKAGLGILDDPNPFGMRILGNTSFAWTILTLAIGLNAIFISYLYFVRAWEFSHHSSRLDEFSEHREHGE